ncbi:methylmalonyl-CoA mutase [Pelomyxa schiedti]|nr:methylmalonyl-CoA mutase [Pelomyxa schiedti]
MTETSNTAATAVEKPVPHRPVRIITGCAAYDGHDASIHAVNRALRETPNVAASTELIYVGFNRKVCELVQAAVEEGCDCVAVSSYNGGHNHFFPALVRNIKEAGGNSVVVGGGGGTILPADEELIEKAGAHVYGQKWTLENLAKDVILRCVENCDESRSETEIVSAAISGAKWALGLILNAAEESCWLEANGGASTPRGLKCESLMSAYLAAAKSYNKQGKLIAVTGDGGAGKSTLTDEIAGLFSQDQPSGTRRNLAILSIDPTTNRGGNISALLGDRIRMTNIYKPNVFMRSVATRIVYGNFPPSLSKMLSILRAGYFDLVIFETPGTGQVGLDFAPYKPDLLFYVKTKEFGSVHIQLEKDQLLLEADAIILNKIDREGSKALCDQLQVLLAHASVCNPNQKLFPTVTKLANNPATVDMYTWMCKRLSFETIYKFTGVDPFSTLKFTSLVPHSRRSYLGLVVDAVRKYDTYTANQVKLCRTSGLAACDSYCQQLMAGWEQTWEKITCNKTLYYTSFNGLKIPKIAIPDRDDTAGMLQFLLEEGLPGCFPYINGVFPLRQESALQTTRQFAGLRLAEHTNERFHFLSQGVPCPRLSTAFDGITLYGDDCDTDAGSIGKIGEGGVSISTLDDMKILYSGFDFEKISTSMTINGPAAIILAMYFNTACDYMIEKYKKQHPEEVSVVDPTLPGPGSLRATDIHPEYGLLCSKVQEIRDCTYCMLRGTIQADILKEMQAQNECIFQEDFAVKLMGDVQEFFIKKHVQKFYSISISGYHIGEAGATPVQELAYSLSNGFTYLENFLGRGMGVNDVAPNFSFFLRNSHELEWLVSGPVCRKIWAVALRDIYHGNERSQAFKYHTQTSGRALQIPEWESLNPVRQTFHALMALMNNTNSLHVDSADEPLTTPSAKYVRQATMIPNFLTVEAELLRAENLFSGSYAHRTIRKGLQEQILKELEAIDQEGGVGPATELGYHRNCIATASCQYEYDISRGKRPIIGRNVCVLDSATLSDFGGGTDASAGTGLHVVRPEQTDWDKQIARTNAFRARNSTVAPAWLAHLRTAASSGANVFEVLLDTVRYASLGQISAALREVGGSFRQMV